MRILTVGETVHVTARVVATLPGNRYGVEFKDAGAIRYFDANELEEGEEQ